MRDQLYLCDFFVQLDVPIGLDGESDNKLIKFWESEMTYEFAFMARKTKLLFRFSKDGALRRLAMLKKPGDQGKHTWRPEGISCQDVLTIAPN
jgi:hypothetical protein